MKGDNIKISSSINFDDNTKNKFNYSVIQGYDILNINDSFYNDICTPYDSEYNTDVLLVDRKKEYYDNNIILCENNCTYNSYNIIENRILCNCDIKTEINTSIDDINPFNFKELTQAFYNLSSYTN